MLRKTSVALILYITLLGTATALAANDIDAVRAVVYDWSRVWQSRNIESYISYYSPAFRSKEYDYDDWLAKKTTLFQRHSSISLKISDLWVFIEGKSAIATFVQQYQNPIFTDVGEKTLLLVKTHDTWKIVSEEWKPLTFALPVIPRTQNMVPTPLQESDNNYQGKESIDFPAKNITFAVEKEREAVCIDLNKLAMPVVSSLEGSKPRVVIDIKNISSWTGPNTIPVNGRVIKQIRTFLHRDSEKLRVVLDLTPSEEYMISQTYYKATNMYCLQVQVSARESGTSR